MNLTNIMNSELPEKHRLLRFGQKFYAYITPIIVSVGICGNALSLSVFQSRSLRNVAASRYLAALSIADISTLVFYVSGEWVKRGLKQFFPEYTKTFLDTEGVCQIWLYLNYFSRFMSSWIIVCFTFERFLRRSMSLWRRNMGTVVQTMKVICYLAVTAGLLVSYKPFLSEVITIRNRTSCSSKQNFVHESFVLDSIYGILITLVPFVIILALDIVIIWRLLSRSRRQEDFPKTVEHQIRLEFTLLLLAVSLIFIAFSLPFFIAWFRHFLHSKFLHANVGYSDVSNQSVEYWTGILTITRTIFYMIYCINFLLYIIMGARFRKELRGLFFSAYRKYDQYNMASESTEEIKITEKETCI